MADTILASLLGMIDKHSVGEVAGALGESEQSVSRGMQLSIPALLGGLVSKCDDPGAVRKVLDLAPTGSGDMSWSSIASGLSDPNSPMISGGKRLLSGLFGTSENAVTSAVSAASGLRPSLMSTLLGMAGPIVMGFLSKRVTTEGISGLCSSLQRESAAIRNALPAGLTDIFWPRASTVGATSPVVAQAVEKEKTSSSWIAALAIAALVLGLFWLFTHGRRTTARFDSMATGTASRLATGVKGLGDYVKRKLPNNVDLNIPERGVEARLLVFIMDPAAKPDRTTWFDFDRLVFDTGSPNLQPESQEQLNNVAAILKAYPNVHLKVGGYTDNVGGTERNLKLSQDRATTVVTDLVHKGIAPNRLSAEGYGEQYPVADNSTEEGRARNRRVSMRVTEK
jgi:OOP family OmpA-OmpF porin